MQRIAKIIANSGYCSRRKAEDIIFAGKVSVDGKPIDSPALNVASDAVIEINGEIISGRKTKLWIYHKPTGQITSHKDPQGRQTVFDAIDVGQRVISVGRLDYNTEGLLLLTNNGDLGNYLENPRNAFRRTYRVRVFGKVTQEQLTKLRNGVTITDKNGKKTRYSNIEANIEKLSTNSWLQITITEGKNREVRNICKHLGLEVSRLIRISYGEFILGNIPMGQVIEVKNNELLAKF